MSLTLVAQEGGALPLLALLLLLAAAAALCVWALSLVRTPSHTALPRDLPRGEISAACRSTVAGGELWSCDPEVVAALIGGASGRPAPSRAVRLAAEWLGVDDGVVGHGVAALAAPSLRGGAVPVYAHAIAAAAARHVSGWARGGPVDMSAALAALSTDLFLVCVAAEDPAGAAGRALAGALSDAAAAAALLRPAAGGGGGGAPGSDGVPPRLTDLFRHWGALRAARDGLRRAVWGALAGRDGAGGGTSLAMTHPETHGAADALAALRAGAVSAGAGGNGDAVVAAVARGLCVLHAEHSRILPVLGAAVGALAADAALLLRVRTEFSRAIGGRPHPTVHDVEACVEARGVYREALRLGCPPELLRVTAAPLPLDDDRGAAVEAPAGARVRVMLRAMHTDAEYWASEGAASPGDFDAGRWRAATRRSPCPAVPGAFAPFLSCPGRAVSELEFLIVLHAIVAEADPVLSGGGDDNGPRPLLLSLTPAAPLLLPRTPGGELPRRAPRTPRGSSSAAAAR